MNSLLGTFLHHVNDIVPPEAYLSIISDGQGVSIEAILNHQAHKFSVFFNKLWWYCFKVYPSVHCYEEFVDACAIEPFDHTKPIKLDFTVIERFLNDLIVMKLGHMTQVNLIEFSKYASDVMGKLNDADFLGLSLLDKFKHRFNVDKFSLDNILYDFVEVLKANRSLTVPKDLDSYAINPVTNYKVCIRSRVILNNDEYLKYVIHKDLHFQKSILHHPVIVCEDESSVDLSLIVKHVSACFNKKCIVLSRTPRNISCARVYKYEDDCIDMIPKIAPWCLIISRDDAKANSHLAFHDDNNVVYDKNKFYNTEAFWKLYSNPQQKYFRQQAEFTDFVYKYASKQSSRIAQTMQEFAHHHASSTPKTYAIFLVDSRSNEMSVMSCKFAMANVDDPKSWKAIVMTSDQSKAFYKGELQGAVELWSHPLLQEPGFDLDTYNDILQDPGLWQRFKEDGLSHVLVVQDDGMLVRPGIEKFLKYDYVGAPWADTPDNAEIKDRNGCLVGNGGMSLRSVDAMLRVTQNHREDKLMTFYHNINRIPEDVWFVHFLKKEGSAALPSPEEASYFSMEQIVNSRSIGFHKFWLYHPIETVRQLFASYLSE